MIRSGEKLDVKIKQTNQHFLFFNIHENRGKDLFLYDFDLCRFSVNKHLLIS